MSEQPPEPLAAGPEALAAIEAALAKIGREQLPPPSPGDAWRFSGRWWANELVRRRPRP